MKRKIGLPALGVIAGALTVLAMLQWASWRQLTRSGSYVETLAQTGWIEDEPSWHRFNDELNDGRDLVRLNPEYQWQLGELRYWQAEGLKLWPKQRNEELQLAKSHYIQAAIRSPDDAELLSRISYRLAYMPDPLAVPVMRRAIDIGLYEPVVQYQLADVGMQFWPQLDPGLRQSLKRMLANGMTNYRLDDKLKATAKRHQRMELLEELSKDSGS